MGKHRLLELKARRSGLQAEVSWCKAHASLVADLRQEDTYFRAKQGRLKVREVKGREGGTLIYYEREDRASPKRSHVLLLPVADPEALIAVLREALGVLAEVRKRRRIFRWGAVQIHLDDVDGLGHFIEFERLVGSEGEERMAETEFAELRDSLRVRDEDLVAGSYSDAVLEAESSADRA